MLRKGKKNRNEALKILKGNRKDYSHLLKIDKRLYYNVQRALAKLPYKNVEERIHNYFGLDYKTYKQLVKHGCSECGTHKRIHLHHKIPKSKGGSNDLKNLIPLCNAHHLIAHNKKEWSSPRMELKRLYSLRGATT